MSEILEDLDMRFVFDIEGLDETNGRLFGGKATGLARMAKAGIPVPPAFAINTDAFRAFQEAGRSLPRGLKEQVDSAVARLSEKSGRLFGGDGVKADPLLVSVRSGAQVSMPGMMDTVLNLGLDAESAFNVIKRTGRRDFVIDSYMRFWKMYAEIVLGLDADEFVETLEEARTKAETSDGDLKSLESSIVSFIESQGEEAATDPRLQLDRAIGAVFGSWNSPRAKAYREHQRIPHDLGTAVTVQAMVFGNAEGESGSGVAFSRNPNTGEHILYGEYLVGRQGEDIVSGAKTPVDLASDDAGHAKLRADLAAHAATLEQLYRDAVDIEFTLEGGRLFLLQVRPAKRTAAAAIRIAADLINDGLIKPHEGLARVSVEQIKRLLRPVFSAEQLQAAQELGAGIGSSPGQATGRAVLDSDRAAERVAAGEEVILVRPTTSPLDIRGMLAANGILTAKGGALSHAAVVSRALDRPCVVGYGALEIDTEARTFTLNGRSFSEGDYISIDGTTGQIFDRKVELITPDSGSESLENILSHADKASGSTVWSSGPVSGPGGGVAVINLADVAHSSGFIDGIVQGVTQFGQGEATADAALAAACEAIGDAILDQTPADRPVHVRLPQPVSPRARFLLPAWPELDQRLFLPIGNPAFQRAMLRGLDAACERRGRKLTVLLGGIMDPLEWAVYKREVEALSSLSGGVVIQNAAGVEVAQDLVAAGAELWIDVDEVINSTHGLIPRAYISNATLDEYVERGALTTNPRKELKPFLKTLFEAAAAGPGKSGILFTGDVEPGLVTFLYEIGYRTFSVPARQRELTRLLLGQCAIIC